VRKGHIHNLPNREFIEELRSYDGTPTAILEDQELMEYLLPMLRADFSVSCTYQHTSYPLLNCPISAFGGLADKDVICDDLTAWKEQTTGNFSLQMVDGGHFFINSSPDILLQSIAENLSSAIKPNG
jgi:medium-chain acyl-[acyl-carrier-protein] hydrolase